MCNKKIVLEVDDRDFRDWKSGARTQDVFPYLSIDEREILVSRVCGKCFDKVLDEK